eukprot:6429434-Ditylum_brightwellii.AAC.1
MQQCLKKLGLTWKPSRVKKKTFKAYQSDAIWAYLIDLAKVMAGIKDGDNMVMVFIDKSYIHKYYQQKFSFMHEESKINKKSGSGN